MIPVPTVSQTVGPYLRVGLDWLNCDDIAAGAESGTRIALSGRLLDGDGKPVSDGVIEIWQANAHGRYPHPEDRQNKPLESGFKGFARLPTGTEGQFHLTTIKPGPVPAAEGGVQAPHLVVGVFARGTLKRLATRVYFPDEPSNGDDPVLRLVPAGRRPTLIARRQSGAQAYAWDIVLQGENETVFFDC